MRRFLFVLLFALACNGDKDTKEKTGQPEPIKDPKPTQVKVGGCDMSSDDAVRKVYLKLTRKSLGSQDCILRPSSFQGLARVGLYKPDLGCRYDTLIYQCSLVGTDIAVKVMDSAGWNTGTPEQKQALALAWMIQVKDVKPLNESNTIEADQFKSQGMRLPPPEFEMTPDGGLKLRYWIKLSNAGTSSKEVFYKRHQVTFGPDGVETGSTILASFSYKPN